MKIRLFVLLFTLLQTGVVAQSKTYILVHGAWHGAWCWQKVVPLLQAQGHRAWAIDLPGHGADQTPAAGLTLADYVHKVVATAQAQPGPVILVGHSMAGVVIAQAAEVLGPQKVAKLVFLDAFMPQNGESVLALATQAGQQNPDADSLTTGPSLADSQVRSADGKLVRLQPERVGWLLYHDCSPHDVAFAKANLVPEPVACLVAPVRVTAARYGRIPKFYILCTQAKDLNKRSLAQHVACQKVFTLASSHSPFFSMPEKLVGILHAL